MTCADDQCENYSEIQHQMEVFSWANEEIANGRDELKLLGAIPNGWRQVRTGSIFHGRKLGFLNGMPDIYLLLPRGGFHGLFIELKSTKKSARLSNYQKRMQLRLFNNGYAVKTCNGYENVIDTINWYCGL